MPANKFTDIEPLDYYYLHGYKIMNPLCRITAASPQNVYLLDAANANGNDVAANSAVTKMLMDLKSAADSAGWGFMGLDETVMAAILTGDPRPERRELVKEFGSDAVPSARKMLKGHRQEATERLSQLAVLLKDAKQALELRSRPGCSWVIRGDSSGMTKYLKTQGIEFSEVIDSNARCYHFGKDWQTNQFFSTSDSDTLASLAGRALVWLIRIDPERTSGRVGGAYSSEDEVLFPYGVQLRLEGGIDVASEDDIGKLQLNAFGQPETLRAKLLNVYRANRMANKARFLIARES